MKVFTNHREKSSCNLHKMQLNPSKDPMFTHFQWTWSERDHCVNLSVRF